MTIVYNFGSLVMLFVPVANDTAAFNWAFAVTVVALTGGLIVLYRPQSRRYDVDAAAATAADELDVGSEDGVTNGGNLGYPESEFSSDYGAGTDTDASSRTHGDSDPLLLPLSSKSRVGGRARVDG